MLHISVAAGVDRAADREHPSDDQRDREDEPLDRVRQMWSLRQLRRWNGGRIVALGGWIGGDQIEVHRSDRPRELGAELFDVDPPDLGEGEALVGEFAPTPGLRLADRAEDLHLAARRGRLVDAHRYEAPIDEHRRAVVLFEGGEDIVTRQAVL